MSDYWLMRSRVRSPALPQILKLDYVWNWVHPASWGQLVSYLIEKSKLLDLLERNVNRIIPSCCHLTVSCRSLVDRCGSLGNWKTQIYLIICKNQQWSEDWRAWRTFAQRDYYNLIYTQKTTSLVWNSENCGEMDRKWENDKRMTTGNVDKKILHTMSQIFSQDNDWK